MAVTGKPQLPEYFVEMLQSVTGKRARTVIDHILEHGYITTEELSEKYGHDHPPRAARDVRESGIPLETFRVTDSRGRRIGAYRFGDLGDVRQRRIAGRRALPKQLKEELMERERSRCQVCLTHLDGRYLQIDHRVPYEIGGEPAGKLQAADFMLLCSSCNRAKSWSCENCGNRTGARAPELCKTCYWGDPTEYSHIALLVVRRLELTWTDKKCQTMIESFVVRKRLAKNFPILSKACYPMPFLAERNSPPSPHTRFSR